jgi:hypothetical protein
MIVRDFDFVGVALVPTETDAPLIVDADAVLSSTIAGKSFQPIRRWYAQIVQPFSDIELNQFAPSQPM